MTRRSREPRPAVEWRGGVHIAGTPLWCDAHRAREACFVSSALVVAARRHRQVIATRETLELLPEPPRSRRGSAVRALAVPTGRPFTLGDVRLELFPSGAMTGAASLLVDVGQRRIVYAGAVQTRAGRLVSPAEGRACDVLVVDATFARFRYPAPASVLDDLAAWAARVLGDGDTPVVLAPALTAAPEALSRLALVAPLRAHRAVAAFARKLAGLGVTLPPAPRLAGPTEREIVVAPPTARDAPGVGDLPRARFAFLSGFAADGAVTGQLRVEAAFPFLEAAGGDDLLDYVAQSGARTVYLVGHVAGKNDVALTLAERGLVVRRLGPPEQLRLPIS